MDKAELLAIDNDRLRRRATYASITVAALLIVAKLAAYFVTNSVAMLSSLLDSTIDLLASAVTAYGVASALRPPDHEHRFGHGKAEPLAALAQAAFIIGSSVLLGYEALHRLFHPQPVTDESVGYIVMVFAIALTAVLVVFQNYVVRRTNSMAIHADRFHYVGDVAVNVAVIASLALGQWTGLSVFDPVFAILIAAGLAFGAWRIARNALGVLMDHELPEAHRARIKSIIMAQPGARGVHDMRTRSDSDRVFIEFHLELDGALSLREAHVIADTLMDAIRHEFPKADVMIHQDPAGLPEPRLDTRIEGTPARG